MISLKSKGMFSLQGQWIDGSKLEISCASERNVLPAERREGRGSQSLGIGGSTERVVIQEMEKAI